MRKFIKAITSKIMIIALLLLVQFGLLFFIVYKIANDELIGIYVHAFFQVLGFLISLHIISKDENPIYKMAWLIPIIAFPVFGTFFYIFYRNNNISKKTKKLHFSIIQDRAELLKEHPRFLNNREVKYLNDIGWRDYENTKTKFLNSGEEKFQELIKDLKTANDFIFIEYFIMSEGYMFNTIFDILIEKAKKGVEVKIIYDDFGSADRLPFRFRKKMQENNIEIIAFNPMKFHINFAMNYRDHRKIVVIDGKIGYTGGINIGDEYINKIERFGHWLDAGIKIEGEAVWSLTLTFLENWSFAKEEKIDFNKYYRNYKTETDGVVIPFADSPIDKDLTTKNIYLYLINKAKKTIYITTPYLILDNEIATSLKLAALSGVDVKIIIPNIPDKKLVYMVTKSYVSELVNAGIKVYKYMPGFIHSKFIIVDGYASVIGTTNLDFRSFYLHFENNILLYNSSAINSMNDFFIDTLNKSNIITKKELDSKGFFYKLLQAILRGFAPLL